MAVNSKNLPGRYFPGENNVNFYILNADTQTTKYVNSLISAQKSGELEKGEVHIYGQGSASYGEKAFTHDENGISFLVRYLSQASEADLKHNDQLVPSHEAPHLLAQVVLVLLESKGYKWKLAKFPEVLGLHYENDLEEGICAISVADEVCPADCAEINTCPSKGEDLSWDIGEKIKEYAANNALDFVGFRCTSFMEGLSTISMKDIIQGWFNIKRMLKKDGQARFLVATYSNCHGIVAFVEASKDN